MQSDSIKSHRHVAVIKIPFVLDCCCECPKVKEEFTPGAGFAIDYYCTAKNNRKIMGYIEYDSEKVEVPEWCPYREKK